MKHMVIVYSTGSDEFRARMETDLIKFYADHCDNARGGGGGPVGAAPYSVYVAWK
jgi:hypothetical protein